MDKIIKKTAKNLQDIRACAHANHVRGMTCQTTCGIRQAVNCQHTRNYLANRLQHLLGHA